MAMLLHVIDKQLPFESLEGPFLKLYADLGGQQIPPLADRARRTLLPVLVQNHL
jgi:hypothetical protein